MTCSDSDRAVAGSDADECSFGGRRQRRRLESLVSLATTHSPIRGISLYWHTRGAEYRASSERYPTSPIPSWCPGKEPPTDGNQANHLAKDGNVGAVETAAACGRSTTLESPESLGFPLRVIRKRRQIDVPTPALCNLTHLDDPPCIG